MFSYPYPFLPLLDSPYILRTITPIFSSSHTSRIPTVLPQNAITPALVIGINNKTQNTPLARNIDLGKGKAKRQTTQAIPWCAFGTLLAIQGFENGDGIGTML